jgi:hypothetical protein
MEDTQMIIEGMAMQGAEPTYCMGDDSPLPVLSSRPHALADYFKQRFAQVRAPMPASFIYHASVSKADIRLRCDPYKGPQCDAAPTDMLLACAGHQPAD